MAAIGRMYRKAKEKDFFIKETCFFISGGYVLKIADIYSFRKINEIAPAMLVAVVTIVSWFIIAYCVSEIIIGFIHWIRRGYEYTDYTIVNDHPQSTTQRSPAKNQEQA